MKKPPAFQFYVKDWRSSPTVRRMSLAQKGVAIETLAASWDQDEPGTLPICEEDAAKVCGIPAKTFRNFRKQFPKFWREHDGMLVNLKLRGQWGELEQIRRSQSDAAKRTNEKRGRGPSVTDAVSDTLTDSLDAPSATATATASATATATANSKPNPPIIPPRRGDPSYLEFGGELIEIFMGRSSRLFTQNEWNSFAGARASDLVAKIRARGFRARIVPEAEVETWPKAETAGAVK